MSPSVAGVLAAIGVLAVVVAATGLDRTITDARVRRRARLSGVGPGPTVGLGPTAAALAALRSRARRLGVLTGAVEREQRRADRELPALLDQVTRQLRSGASLPVAVQSAAAGRSDRSTGRLADDLAAGVGLTDAVAAWQGACPTPARSLTAAALGLAADAGGAVAVVLDGVTDTLRDRVALEREVGALSSQSRASAAVLVAAPLAFAALASTLDRRVAAALLGSPAGWACLAAGAALDAVGALWMARLVARAR